MVTLLRKAENMRKFMVEGVTRLFLLYYTVSCQLFNVHPNGTISWPVHLWP